MFVVYCLFNIRNGKFYVGETYNFKKRMNEHKGSARRGSGFLLSRAIQSHGWENFEKTILTSHATLKEALEAEKFWIRELSAKIPSGYNLTDGGEGFVGLKRTLLHQQRLADANRGRRHTLETIEQISRNRKGKGKGLKPANFEKHHTPETIEQIRQSCSGEKCFWFGKKGENSARRKLSEADVREIRNLLSQNKSYKEISLQFGVGKRAIWEIATFRRWAHVK